MSNIFSADDHTTPDEASFEKGVDNIDGSKEACAGIGDIEDEGVRKAEVPL
jgi:hypothetical protein